jgi:glycosyltransferase involved in cell wall biosynthesis
VKGISIIVCCYNSVARLSKTIESLSKLDIHELEVELIVVDNASTDQTNIVAKNLCEQMISFPWSVVTEVQPGLTQARLKGIDNARHDILLFCDDDNWLPNDYLQNGILHAEDSSIAIWGAAKSIGVFEEKIQDWIFPYLRMLAIFDNATDRVGASLDDHVIVSGAGMFMRKSFAKLYQQAVASNPLRRKLGRTSDQPLAGEDSDMHYLVYQNNLKTAFYTDLYFHHWMPASRLQKKYLLQLKRNMSKSTVLLQFIHQEPIGQWSVFGLLWYILKNSFVNIMETRMTIQGYLGHLDGIRMINNLNNEN